MSEDPDFDMEVVEKDKLDESRGNTEAGSHEAASSKSSGVERKSTNSGISKSSGGESAEEARVTGNGGGSKASPSLADSPDAWRQIKLGDLLSYEVSGTWGDDPDDGGGKPVLRATNFAPNSIDLGDVALRKISDSHRESKRLREGDIVLERSGGSADQPVGRVLFFDLEGEYYPGNFLRLMRPDPEVVNRRYLYYYLDYRYKRGDTIPVQTNSTNIRNLQYASYLNLDTQLPPLSEQRKIASVLCAVDRAIQKTEDVIEQHRTFRQALINYLLSEGVSAYSEILDRDDLKILEGGISTDMDRTSVGRSPSSWERVRLSEVTSESLYGVAESAQDFDPHLPRYVRITDISDDGRLKNEDPASLPAAAFDQKYLLSAGDLLFARSGATVGKTFLYRDHHPKSVYAGYLIRFVPDTRKVLPEYLFYYTQTRSYQDWVTRVTRKGAQENINAQEYGSILLPLPPLEEQEVIVEILEQERKAISEEIAQEKRLKRVKIGLMQDLLTGEVRTGDKAIEVLDEVAAHG